jgi:sialate O-acetylesterase
MEIPVHFHDTKIDGFQGFVWFRKSIEIPREYRKKDLILRMGKIEQEDITYFNGHKAGSHDVVAEVREYKIPAKWIKKGKNTIAVRVKHTRSHGGGLYEGPYELIDPEKDETILSLSGKWSYNENIEEKLPELKSFVHYPGALFNAMVAPVIPYAIKGTIWYQGEGNASRAYQYRTLFPLMINDWRIRWQQGNYPFLFVQLANFLPHDSIPTMDPWPELREAQTMTLNLPNTGMATAIDLGEMYNIHPKNKQDVGKRLALAARKIAYHEDIVYSGPMYDSMHVENNKIRIFFSHTGGGLAIKGNEKSKGFAIAGKDKKFVWANAKIDGNTVFVWSDKIPNPVAVRYAWSNNPVCNLYNKEGLPAVPFRTDKWKGITFGKK